MIAPEGFEVNIKINGGDKAGDSGKKLCTSIRELDLTPVAIYERCGIGQQKSIRRLRPTLWPKPA
jgi:hypothetical protein